MSMAAYYYAAIYGPKMKIKQLVGQQFTPFKAFMHVANIGSFVLFNHKPCCLPFYTTSTFDSLWRTELLIVYEIMGDFPSALLLFGARAESALR